MRYALRFPDGRFGSGGTPIVPRRIDLDSAMLWDTIGGLRGSVTRSRKFTSRGNMARFYFGKEGDPYEGCSVVVVETRVFGEEKL